MTNIGFTVKPLACFPLIFLKDERRIRERITSIRTLWNANEVQAVLDLFAPDAIHMAPGQAELIGKDGRYFRFLFKHFVMDK